jgi:aryl-phospho-beta-D-glucosidase BglC (GH1 family)
VRLAGVSWFGFETANYVVHGLWSRGYEDMLAQITQLGFNSIRLPYCNAILAPSAAPPSGIDFNKNPDLQGLSSLQILDKIIGAAGALGLRVILDRHCAKPDNHMNEPLWYIPRDPTSTEQAWIDGWVTLAKRYAGNPTVIGADLHNEPHWPATWGDGSMTTDWRLAAERCGNAVLAANPDWLIFVEGVETYAGKSDWWGGNLAGVAANPVRLPNKLVYSPHDYPASIYQQPWFDHPNYPNNLVAIWDSFWGSIHKQNLAPIWIGGFGTKLQTESDQHWYQAICSYITSLGLNWCWWSWNPNSGHTGGILADDWQTVNQNKLQLLTPIMN